MKKIFSIPSTLVAFGALFLYSAGTSSIAQKPLEIEVAGLADTTINLAVYFGDKLFYNDTTQLVNGKASFAGKKFEDGGKYSIVLPGPKLLDVLVTEEGVKLKTDINDPINKLEVVEGEENRIFYDYIKYINGKKEERTPFDQIMLDSTATEKAKGEADKSIKKLNTKVRNYQSDLVSKHGDKLVGKLIKASFEIEIPEAPEGTENADVWKYNYYKTHYWDNFDLKDPRMVRDQAITRLLNRYLNNVVPQMPDSLCHYASALIEETRDSGDLFKFLVQNATHQAETSKIMCMDKAFVCLVDTYFATGQATWLNEEQLQKILDAANDKRGVLCETQIPNIILPDTSGQKWEALYDVDANYTVVLIWESTCGHCKKEMPALMSIYEDMKPLGIEFYAIGNDFETEGWEKFVKEKKLAWINVSDNPEINKNAQKYIVEGKTNIESLNFRKTFNIQSTPQIFVLDKDKKLVGKGLGGEQLRDFLERLLEQDARKEDEG